MNAVIIYCIMSTKKSISIYLFKIHVHVSSKYGLQCFNSFSSFQGLYIHIATYILAHSPQYACNSSKIMDGHPIHVLFVQLINLHAEQTKEDYQ